MIQILTGDALNVLREMPDESVNCCVTSPPYWGLRDYGIRLAHLQRGNWSAFQPSKKESFRRWQLRMQARAALNGGIESRDKSACVAVLGLEKTPEMFVKNLTAIFREVRRVLRNDGTAWVNLGDSYAGSGKGIGDTKTNNKSNGASRGVRIGSVHGESGHTSGVTPPKGWKAKDLIGIPWRVAFALQADGWYLRSDIIWAKPNPMPESVTDRPTKAHEYIFLLSKSAKYFYDADAIKEAAQPDSTRKRPGANCFRGAGHFGKSPANRNGRDMTEIGRDEVRNKRSVWDVATAPFSGCHFATYPPALIRPCILAGCPVGGIVLDPFAGSGTTGQVAIEEGRRAVLIELNPEYIKLIEQRTNVTIGLPLQ